MQNCIHLTQQPYFVENNWNQVSTQEVVMSYKLIRKLSCIKDAKKRGIQNMKLKPYPDTGCKKDMNRCK